MVHKIETSEYYDKEWNKDKYKHPHYELPWYPVWKQIVNWIPEKSNVLDLGCGAGFFTNVLIDNKNINSYIGYDFSPVAIEKAKKKISDKRYQFIVGDIRDNYIYNNEYEVVVLTEVLEHLKNDIKCLNKIDKNKLVLFSLPTFLGESHFRMFENENEIIERYKKILDIKEILYFKKGKNNIKINWFVCKAYKK
jgi:2-polyprenyl-3-methyl-5-hydroxy-6-metoxy-1,4-benzoquinol methylase